MSTPVTLPALGESVTEGTVTRWLKQVGDTVAVDEPLLEVSTDKVDTEIPSPVAGTLLEITAAEDETVEVGAQLCVIGAEGEAGGQDDAGCRGAGVRGARRGARCSRACGDQEPAARCARTPPRRACARSRSARPAAPTASGTPVTLPGLGESVTEGTVTRWLKQVGDEVAVDEPLLEVSTDKVDTEIPSPVAGTLLEIKVAEDETVEVGAELAVIGAAGLRAVAGTRRRAGAALPASAAAEARLSRLRRSPSREPAAPAAEAAPPRSPPQPRRHPQPRRTPAACRRRPPLRTASPATGQLRHPAGAQDGRRARRRPGLGHRAPASAGGSASRTSSPPPRPQKPARRRTERRRAPGGRRRRRPWRPARCAARPRR